MAQNHDLVEMSLAGGAPLLPLRSAAACCTRPVLMTCRRASTCSIYTAGRRASCPLIGWLISTGISMASQPCRSFVSKVLIDNGVVVPQCVAGVGVDHWERVTADPSFTRCLRVPRGSGFFACVVVFPRKRLMYCFVPGGRAFSAADDVTLVIKTFPNPHTISALMEAARHENDDYPNVVLIEDDLTSEALKALDDGL